MQPPPHQAADFMSLYQDTEEQEAMEAEKQKMLQEQGMHEMPDGSIMPNSEMEQGAGGYAEQNNADSTGY